MQALACGEIGGLAEAREVVRRSFAIATYEPVSRTGWDEAYGQFLQMFHDQELSH